MLSPNALGRVDGCHDWYAITGGNVEGWVMGESVQDVIESVRLAFPGKAVSAEEVLLNVRVNVRER